MSLRVFLRVKCELKSQMRCVKVLQYYSPSQQGFPDSSVGKESACNAGDPSSIPGLGRSTLVFQPREFHGLYPRDCKESDMTERLSLTTIALANTSVISCSLCVCVCVCVCVCGKQNKTWRTVKVLSLNNSEVYGLVLLTIIIYECIKST